MLIGTGVYFVAAETESCKPKNDFAERQPARPTRSEGIALESTPAHWPRFKPASQHTMGRSAVVKPDNAVNLGFRFREWAGV